MRYKNSKITLDYKNIFILVMLLQGETPSIISDFIAMSKGSLSPRLKSLEEKGLLISFPCLGTKHRTRSYAVTEKGKKVLRSMSITFDLNSCQTDDLEIVL